MPKPYKPHVGGPLADYADGFVSELSRLRYAEAALANPVRVMARLSQWLESEGVTLGELGPTEVERFRSWWRSAGWRRVPTGRVLGPLFSYLQARGAMSTASPVTPQEEMLASYHFYLVGERGLARRTAERYEGTAQRFLSARTGVTGGPTGAEALTGEDVTAFLLSEKARGLAVGSLKGRVAELRSLLRFLHINGVVPAGLAGSVPPVAGWRGGRLPAPALSTVDVAALLASCDRSQVTGRRDFAVITVLARLGLRAAEVAGLALEDIDWRAGELVVRGKGRREDHLPLPADVGEALVGYITEGRPRIEGHRAVFLTRYAPFGPMSTTAVTNAVQRACLRAGLAPVRAHALRHALATELLRRGSSLVQISQVLRHRDLATTAVYAKVDYASLRQVARPWPGSER